MSVIRDLLLVNPVAGGGRSARAVHELREFANRRGWNVEICVTASAEELVAKAREAATTGRKRIFVLGGDGTFQLFMNAVSDYPEIILGVIPAGGGNDLAAALGLPADPVAAAALLLDGEICELDVVKVRTADGRERLYTGGGGVGLDAEAARYANGRLPQFARTFALRPGRASRFVWFSRHSGAHCRRLSPKQNPFRLPFCWPAC